MKSILALCVTLILLTACAGTPTPVAPVDLLILSPQGVAPEKDTIGFNVLVRNVTQAFAAELLPALQSAGLTYRNVLDQQPGQGLGEKLAIHSVRNGARQVILLTVEVVSVDDDEQLQLQAQFIEQEFTQEKAVVSGVKAVSVLTRSYRLRGSRSGDNPASIDELAADYVAYLQGQKRLR